MKKLLCILGFLLCVEVVATHSSAFVPEPTTIVFERTFKNQLGVIPKTTLFTPTSADNYRVSLYLESSDGVNFPAFHLFWTDDFESIETAVLGYDVAAGGAPAWGTHEIIVRSVANAPIQFETFINNNAQGTYNVHIVIEKL